MTVAMTVDGPQPARATVDWGDTVTFANSDGKVHQITIPRVSLREPGDRPRRHVRRTCSTAAAATTATARPGAARTSSATIVVELNGSVTLKASATSCSWGKPLRLTGKSTFPGTPVNDRGARAGQRRAWAKVGSDGGGGRRLVRGGVEATAGRPVSRAGRRRPDFVRHGAESRSSRRSRFARSARRAKVGGRVTDHRPGDAGARGDDARPAAARPASRAAGSQICASGRRRRAMRDVQLEGCSRAGPACASRSARSA